MVDNNGHGVNGDGKPKEGKFVVDLGDFGQDVMFSRPGDLPWRGPMGHIPREDDPQHLRPVVTSEFKTKIFDLSDSEQKEEYDLVLSVVHSSESMVIYRDDLRWVEENKNWVALIQWVENYNEDPKFSARQTFNRLHKDDEETGC